MGEWDAIVIGAGHNGLAAAASLARAGRNVIVPERSAVVGGLAASEGFHPGYRSCGILHDTATVRTDLIRDLRLDRYGLKVKQERASVTLFSKTGETIVLSADTDATVRSIREVSKRDADAYPRYRAFCDRVAPLLRDLFDTPLPPYVKPTLQPLLRLARFRLLGRKMLKELLQVAPMSVADFLGEYFETDFLKAGLALPALQGTFAGPLSSLTAFYLLRYESTARVHVERGPSALTEALEKAALSYGATIHTGAEVERITTGENGHVTGVRLATGETLRAPIVMASCAPLEVFSCLVGSQVISPRFEREILRVRSRGTTAYVALALRQKLHWKCDTPVVHARIAHGIMDLERAFDAVKYGHTSQTPMLSLCVPTAMNPALAPEGHSVVTLLAQYAPTHEFSLAAKADFADRIVDMLAQHVDGLREALVTVCVLGPADFEKRLRLPGGHLHHGEEALDQLLTRPTVSCVGHRTPIPGLLLCGSGSAPGGGITCAPGILAARTILRSGRSKKPVPESLV